MTRGRLALVAGLALVGVAIVVTLTRSPPVVVWSDYTPINETFAQVSGGARACQPHEVLPRGAFAVRLSLYAGLGPRVSVKVLSGDRVLTSGVRDAGWTGESPTVPLLPVSRGAPDVRLCFALGQTSESVTLDGNRASPADATTSQDGGSLEGRMRIAYLGSGNSSWLSLARSVARRAGLGRWPAGTWVPLLVTLLFGALVACASWLAVRELR